MTRYIPDRLPTEYPPKKTLLLYGQQLLSFVAVSLISLIVFAILARIGSLNPILSILVTVFAFAIPFFLGMIVIRLVNLFQDRQALLALRNPQILQTAEMTLAYPARQGPLGQALLVGETLRVEEDLEDQRDQRGRWAYLGRWDLLNVLDLLDEWALLVKRDLLNQEEIRYYGERRLARKEQDALRYQMDLVGQEIRVLLDQMDQEDIQVLLDQMGLEDIQVLLDQMGLEDIQVLLDQMDQEDL